MQATDEAGKHLKNKGDEDAINFRPSSNFKYMKKYCKGKMEASSGSRGDEEEVRPPLPRGPPPPDSPPPLLTPKEELDEDAFPPPAEDEPKDTRVMCRQFARGSCTRGSACIYVHDIILKQLPGIYTFCRDYQNTTCTFQRCKFVHASVFEKEYFYRTGYLPPHATAHLKDVNAPLMPVHSQPEGGPAEAPPQAAPPAAFPGPAPAPQLRAPEPRQLGEALSAFGAAAAAYQASVAPAAAPAPPRGLVDLGEPGRAEPAPMPRDGCSNCHYTELRARCAMNKVDLVRSTIQDLDKKMAAMDKKTSKLITILTTVMKYPPIFEKMRMLLPANRISSNMGGHSSSSGHSAAGHSSTGHSSAGGSEGNMTLYAVLARLLLSAEDAPPPLPDS